MEIEKLAVRAGDYVAHLARIGKNSGNEVVVLFHGYFEDGRIFYSNSGKGLAPFLAQHGYDVFVVDFPGKSSSDYRISHGLNYSQHDIITGIIPATLEKVREISGKSQLHLGAHSWGGVVVMAYLVRYKDNNICSFFSFGAKRRIGRVGWRKWLYIDFGWHYVGKKLTNKYGFLPSQKMRMGNQDEPKAYYEETTAWIYDRFWKDPKDGFDYGAAFEKYDAPPAFYITGASDHILGHPKDVQALMNEMQSEKATYKTIGKATGHLHNYDHINLLTHKDAPKDHFQLIVKFLKENTCPLNVR
jgi:pimeloyl-ACP methyl ester carboxylesterase